MKMLQYMNDHEIGAFAMYPIMVPMQRAYEDLGYQASDFPVGSEYANRVFNLPMFETLREDEAREVAKTILAYYDQV